MVGGTCRNVLSIAAYRRVETIRLLAELDQDEREAATIASDWSLTKTERQRARAYRDFFRRSAARAEALLAKLEAES